MYMKRFDTPIEVARELAKHAPRRLGTVLDPAAGTGALLVPFTEHLKRNRSRLYCVDSDSDALADLKVNLKPLLGSAVTMINADFMDWSSKQPPSSFDCILMNPPFSGTKAGLRKIVASEQLRNLVDTNRYMPLEAAFLCKAHNLLKDNGRLLAILPCSIVMAQSMQWVRDFLIKTGAIRSIHELPSGSFRGVESRMYLLIYDKAKKQRKLKLYNHDLNEPDRFDLSFKRDISIDRLDFGYHNALQKMGLLQRNNRFAWRLLRDVAYVLRGDVSSPLGSLSAIHTSDYLITIVPKQHLLYAIAM